MDLQHGLHCLAVCPSLVKSLTAIISAFALGTMRIDSIVFNSGIFLPQSCGNLFLFVSGEASRKTNTLEPELIMRFIAENHLWGGDVPFILERFPMFVSYRKTDQIFERG